MDPITVPLKPLALSKPLTAWTGRKYRIGRAEVAAPGVAALCRLHAVGSRILSGASEFGVLDIAIAFYVLANGEAATAGVDGISQRTEALEPLHKMATENAIAAKAYADKLDELGQVRVRFERAALDWWAANGTADLQAAAELLEQMLRTAFEPMRTIERETGEKSPGGEGVGPAPFPSHGRGSGLASRLTTAARGLLWRLATSRFAYWLVCLSRTIKRKAGA